MTPSVEDVIERLENITEGRCGDIADPITVSKPLLKDALALLDLLRWRDVEKELPEPNTKVWCCNTRTKDPDYFESQYLGTDGNGEGVFGEPLFQHYPTHWLPIPPTGDSNE